jgi:CIC family chloride channel protein
MRRQLRLTIDVIVIGVLGSLGARLFIATLSFCESIFLGHLAGYRLPGVAGEGRMVPVGLGPHGCWLIPAVTTLGGLITGLLVYLLAPEAEGHGTDTAIRAFHESAGVIRARVPGVKLIASAVTIGSGGSAGREGPAALISAGIASGYARIFKRDAAHIRLLLLVGIAAGLSAVFRAPIGSAVFAIEVLYSDMEFESGALLYTLLGAVVAYAINGFFIPFRPLFEMPAGLTAPPVRDYGWYAALGAAGGLVAVTIPPALYRTRDFFRGLAVPRILKPAIGGAALGFFALIFPQVLSGGYGWIQEAIDGRVTALLLLPLAFAKIVSFSLTIGSGESGGVFAPTLFVGAMLGGFMAEILGLGTAPFVMVGMAAVFAGAARVPIATLLMVTEMTGGFPLLVPAALAIMISVLLQVAVSSRSKYRSLYEAQVPTRVASPAHYSDELQAAFQLLKRGDLQLHLSFGKLELASLLASGVPVVLPDGNQLRIGRLRPQSSCVGQPMQSGCLNGAQHGPKAILAFRSGRLLEPSGSTPLQPGDLILAVTSEKDRTGLGDHLEDLKQAAPRGG